MYNNHPLKLPRLPEQGFEFDYVRFGDNSELVATCPRCKARQRTGVFVTDEVPDRAIGRIKDRIHRYHVCRGFDFAALESRAGIDVVMRAFGFPEELMPQPDRPRRARWGKTTPASTNEGEK